MSLAQNLPHPESAYRSLNDVLAKVASLPPVERRTSDRKDVMRPILIQRINTDLAPIGNEIEALSQDVSPSGIGFLATEPIKAQYLCIHFTDESDLRGESVYAKVMHESRRGPLFSVGTRVVTDWDY